MHETKQVAEFQKRIAYAGDLRDLLLEVCAAYDLGAYQEHSVILSGYEDFNLIDFKPTPLADSWEVFPNLYL